MKRLLKFYVLLLLVFFLICNTTIYAQNKKEKEKLSPKERIFFGGNIGLQIGTITQIEIAPLVGYRITPRLSAGLGVKYEYYKDFFYETHIYGGRLFSNYLFIKDLNNIIPLGFNGGLFIQGEYEALNLETRVFDVLNEYPGQDRFWLHSVLVGGGLRLPAGKRSSINLTILYNLNQTANTPYSNPIIRFGVYF
ncbi:MAG TPA: hypothetical protein VE912_16765 [Bacteroidales bacterium]|nr:hypothetical protein [Bacteroidales bacterium]